MPRAKRACLASRSRPQPSSVAGASSPRNRGLLSVQPRATSRQLARQADDDDGTPFPEEILLFIFASFLEIADLVRCAATCRRWLRLVSSEAAFILRRTPQRPNPSSNYLPPLVLGFFHQREDTAPRFAPMPSAISRFPVLQGRPAPSLSALVDDDALVVDSSRIVASRNGLVVLELQRGKHNRALKLCVCNPLIGEKHLLPPLSGKDGLGHYACTVLTADEYRQDKNTGTIKTLTPPSQAAPPSFQFCLVLVYSRRKFTASRRYSSADGRWSPEAKVTNAHLGQKLMGQMRNGVVACGGKMAYWLAGEYVFGLHLDTLQATSFTVPWSHDREFLLGDSNTLLCTSPKGTLFAIQIIRPWRLVMGQHTEMIEVAVLNRNSAGRGRRAWERKTTIRLDQDLPEGFASKVKLQWFCEKSGLVFFTVGCYCGDQRNEVYSLCFGTRRIRKVETNDADGGWCVWGSLYGYEMDPVAYLTSLSP